MVKSWVKLLSEQIDQKQTLGQPHIFLHKPLRCSTLNCQSKGTYSHLLIEKLQLFETDFMTLGIQLSCGYFRCGIPLLPTTKQTFYNVVSAKT